MDSKAKDEQRELEGEEAKVVFRFPQSNPEDGVLQGS